MSRAYDEGQQNSMDTYDELKLEDWHSISHAYGWIDGLENVITNYYDTMVEYEEGSEDYKDLEESIDRMEKAKRNTQKIIDQVEGSPEHFNNINTLMRTIANLNDRIEDLEKEI